jgi:hypothetical protein
VFEKNPRSLTKADGPLSMLSPRATEEHFRTRQYVAGDDLRRVHWKQSINTGHLIVRVAESVPFAPSRVRLVLDSYLPPAWRVSALAGGRRLKDDERAVARAPEVLDDVLDLLVEAWVGLASTLLKRGEAVSLVTAVRDGERTVVREIECKRGEERKWRAIGSDVAWQHDFPLEGLFASVPAVPNARAKTASSIIVSSGLWLGGANPAPGTSFVVADGSSVIPDAQPDAWGPLKRLLFFDYPVGADDNRIDWRRLFSPRPPDPEQLRRALRGAAGNAVERARGLRVPVLLIRRRGLNLSLESP